VIGWCLGWNVDPRKIGAQGLCVDRIGGVGGWELACMLAMVL